MASRRADLLRWTLGLILLDAGAAGAQEVSPPPDRPVELGVETDLASLYLFRGLVYSAGAVTQSKVWVSTGGLEIYGWTNVALPAAPGARTLDEVDAGASYAIERGRLTIAPAIDVYMYRLSPLEQSNGAASHTAELSVTASYRHGGTTLSSRQVVDVRSYRGAFFGLLTVTHARPLSASADLEIGALGGWASRRFSQSYFGPAVSGVAMVGASVSVTRRVGHRGYLRPHVDLTYIPASPLRAVVSRPFNVVAGCAIGVVR